jgi:hypothetical protein
MTDILINSRTNAVLESLDWSGPNARWITERAPLINAAHADMMAEKAAQSNNGAVK